MMRESGAGVDGGAREPTRAEREARRDTFLGDAADYAAARPGYPDEVLEAAVALAGLPAGGRVLELGCGTGFATSWLAERGFEVLAVDRSAEMAAYAREALAGHPTVEVRVGDFESLAPEGGRDAVVAATSYHWFDPVDRAARCAAHLRPGGALVLLWHTHPPPYDGFFERAAPVFRRHMPGWTQPPSPGMQGELIRAIVADLESSGLYARPVRRAFDWTRAYDRVTYQRLVATYSDHRLLPEATRRAILEELGRVVDGEPDGRVVHPYRTELVVARTRG
jgi:SAM-dependent methyltransferase